ncbi:hypothetical protein HDV06_001635 [Boothiomyces sp. JEL0866]|nr:hypothetical protein HDV06_001635 [Boothiomyces sp. JEL0866]
MNNRNNDWDDRIRNEQNERLLESQTDGLAGGLADKVSKIKQITLQMQGRIDDDHV